MSRQIYEHQATFSVLGSDILVRCVHKACLDGIVSAFRSLVIDPWRTPDVILDSAWTSMEPYLYRARSPEQAREPLAGLRVHTRGVAASADWPFALPPFPPWCVPPFANTFVGIHGAAVESPEGICTMLVGPRGSGKTTLSLLLANQRNWRLLSDEVTVLHRRTALVSPYPLPVACRSSADLSAPKRVVSAFEACMSVAVNPALVRMLVFLTPAKFTALQPLARAQVFRGLMEQHLDLGCDLSECMVTLLQLARTIPAWRLCHRGYQDLLNAPLVLEKLRPEGKMFAE